MIICYFVRSIFPAIWNWWGVLFLRCLLDSTPLPDLFPPVWYARYLNSIPISLFSYFWHLNLSSNILWAEDRTWYFNFWDPLNYEKVDSAILFYSQCNGGWPDYHSLLLYLKDYVNITPIEFYVLNILLTFMVYRSIIISVLLHLHSVPSELESVVVVSSSEVTISM